MQRPLVAAAAALALAFGVWAGIRDTRTAAAQTAPPQGPPPPQQQGAMRPAAPAPVDSFVAERDSLMKAVLAEIAGKEKMPAESVFKNIKLLKGVPAERLPRIMALGWGRALGVRCRHCHVQDHWSDDDKPQKQIARDMSQMMKAINTDLLPKIKNLKSAAPGSPRPPTVNCTTCHRGQVKPALEL